MLYSEKVMENFANPQNVGELEDANGVGEVGNAKCGDIMRMYIKVENDIINPITNWGSFGNIPSYTIIMGIFCYKNTCVDVDIIRTIHHAVDIEMVNRITGTI